jgi:cytidine deaminase
VPEALGIPPDASVKLEALVEAAKAAREHAYAPYSGFRVGAAVLAGGRVYTGANVENASAPLSLCAERAATAAAIAAGEQRVDAAAIVTDTVEPTPPCGGCRQVLWEFGPNSIVVSHTLRGARAVWALEDLFPAAFALPDR